MLEQGGCSKSKIIDEFGLKKHLEVLCGLASGYLDEDFGQIISMKSKDTPSSTNATNLHKKQGELIKFSRD